MASKRQRYDPLKSVQEPRWLVRIDKFNTVIEARELAHGADLRTALADGAETLRRDGWTIEGVSCNGTFVRREGERHYLGVYPTNPHEPVLSMHGPYPGAR